MDDALVQRISQLRDLGTESQRAVEDRVKHELGINLKRDAAGLALDFFLKEKNNPELLHQSLATYWEFAIFFIRVELDKVSTDLGSLTARYRRYDRYISKHVPIFASIIETCDGVGKKLVALRVLENGKLNTKDEAQSQKKIASLVSIAEFKEEVSSCETLFFEIESAIKNATRGAKWVALRRAIMKPMIWFVFPLIVALIAAYLMIFFGPKN